MSQSARYNILTKIKQALSKPVPVPFPQQTDDASVFHAPAEELDLLFAENFTKLQGRFSYCENENSLHN
jgi:L-lactate dehydrogenase complex protein LldG